MMVNLAYGRTGLDVDLPDGCEVLRGREAPGLPDEAQALRDAIRAPVSGPPLARRIRPGGRAVVVHTDITRATPNDRMLPVLLDELELAGVARADISLLNGLGTHRPQTDEETRTLLGDRVVDRYRCVQHDAFDDAGLVSLGATASGHPVRVSRLFMEADIRILTGFIEPHFFAGFSGGPKGVIPAISGAESVNTNHGYAMIAHPGSTWGVTAGNPIWEEMREVALMARPTFLLNVTMNAERRITGVFAGDMLEAHSRGCEFVRRHASVDVAAPFDVVVATNSGYPLDQNLYQAVKGMSAAARIVRQGGAIVMAAACEDGLPDHGMYASLLAEAGSPEALLRTVSAPGFASRDQWQAQVQAMVQQKADVLLYSGGLADAQIRRALLKPCRDIAAAVRALLSRSGPGARAAVMPDGPLTLAQVRPGPARAFRGGA